VSQWVKVDELEHQTTVANLVGCGGCNERRTTVDVGRLEYDRTGATGLRTSTKTSEPSSSECRGIS
jgi:hypothetical protein